MISHCVYKKSAKIINLLKTQKNPKKPNPYPRKGQTGIGFFWVTPPQELSYSIFHFFHIETLCTCLLFSDVAMPLFFMHALNYAYGVSDTLNLLN